MRAALAMVAVVIAAVLSVLLAADNDGDHRSPPAGAQPSLPSLTEDRPTEATVPQRQKIARTANKWARLFAASDFSTSCEYMTQPACEREACVRAGPQPIPNCTPPSPAFRLSFARAKVEDVAIKGNRAAARFSKGQVVELERVSGNELDGVWAISKWGRSAGRGFFE